MKREGPESEGKQGRWLTDRQGRPILLEAGGGWGGINFSILGKSSGGEPDILGKKAKE